MCATRSTSPRRTGWSGCWAPPRWPLRCPCTKTATCCASTGCRSPPACSCRPNVRSRQYTAEPQWLVGLRAPTAVPFALPLQKNRHLLRKHWMSIATGVLVASGVSIATTIWFAQAFGLPVDLQKGLAVRSVTTPFAIEAERVLGGPTDLAALFVLLTGVSGMLMGETILRLLPHVRSKLAAGAILGGAAHGSGVAKARQFGDVQAVVASLVMMIAGALNVVVAPWVRVLFF